MARLPSGLDSRTAKLLGEALLERFPGLTPDEAKLAIDKGEGDRAEAIRSATEGIDRPDWVPAAVQVVTAERSRAAALAALGIESDDKATTDANPGPAVDWDLLQQLKRRYVFVAQTGAYWDTEALEWVQTGALSARWQHAMPVDDKGRSPKPHALLDQSPDALRADVVDFIPGDDRALLTDRGVTRLNLWRPSELKPADGDATPFIEHVRLVVGEDAAELMLDYLAFLVQKPGAKVNYTPVIISKPGLGKDTLGLVMAHIIGAHNTWTLDTAGLVGDFNGFLARTQLAIVPETHTGDKREAYNRLKALITQTTIFVNPKGIAQFQIENRANFLLFSNHEDPVYLESGDRRFWILDSSGTSVPDQAYFDALYDWLGIGPDGKLSHGRGVAIVAGYLASRDLSGFKAHAHAPMTPAKARLLRDCAPTLERWLAEALEAGYHPLDRDVVSLPDLVQALGELRLPGVSIRTVASALRRLGAVELGRARVNGAQPTLWAIRGVRALAEAPSSVWVRCYRGELHARDLERPGVVEACAELDEGERDPQVVRIASQIKEVRTNAYKLAALQQVMREGQASRAPTAPRRKTQAAPLKQAPKPAEPIDPENPF